MQIHKNLLFVLSSVFSRRLKFIYSLDHVVDKKRIPFETPINNFDYSCTKEVRTFSSILIVIYLSFLPTLILYSLHIPS